MTSPFITNEFDTWCPSCGELLSNRDEGFDPDGECPTCGFPDDIEMMAQYHCGDDEECWSCGGEGTYASCEEEFACIDPESGCDLCMRKCDVCEGKGHYQRGGD